MRTKSTGMGADSDPPDGEGDVRDEGYSVETEAGEAYVIYDPENPLAWIKSDRFGPPVDADADDEVGDQEPTE